MTDLGEIVELGLLYQSICSNRDRIVKAAEAQVVYVQKMLSSAVQELVGMRLSEVAGWPIAREVPWHDGPIWQACSNSHISGAGQVVGAHLNISAQTVLVDVEIFELGWYRFDLQHVRLVPAETQTVS